MSDIDYHIKIPDKFSNNTLNILDDSKKGFLVVRDYDEIFQNTQDTLRSMQFLLLILYTFQPI